MLIYNVTVNIEDSVHEEWLKWMQDVHIKEVMNTGLFLENRICRLIGEEKSQGTTYAIQYTCQSMKEYHEYHEKYASALQASHSEKYKDKFVAFRTLLEVVK